MIDVNSAKEEFISIFKANIHRDGADKLLEYLTNSDFFTTPASARYHLAEYGGLCQHSINVYKRLKRLMEYEYGANYGEEFGEETLAICGLMHDVCKVNYYVTEMRNVKEGTEWVKKPYFKVEEKFPYGHGEKSVFIVSQFVKLTPEEAMAINWHMGGFDERVKGGSFSLSEALAKYKLVLLLHIADLQATYLDEDRAYNGMA